MSAHKEDVAFERAHLGRNLTARYMQSELVPKKKDQDSSKNGNDYAAGMKSAASARRIKQMRYRSAYNRTDNPEHNCPQD
jgi:hypothetical protein